MFYLNIGTAGEIIRSFAKKYTYKVCIFHYYVCTYLIIIQENGKDFSTNDLYEASVDFLYLLGNLNTILTRNVEY